MKDNRDINTVLKKILLEEEYELTHLLSTVWTDGVINS